MIKWMAGIILACYLGVSLLPAWDKIYKEELVATKEWFQVHSMQVPNTPKAHDNFRLYVDRTIHKPFLAMWGAEVNRIEPNGSQSLQCGGGGVNYYKPTDNLPNNNNPDLNWWVGGECDLGEGAHQIHVIWVLFLGDYGLRVVEKSSNIFYPKEE